MEKQKTIKIWFKADTERGPYQDALYFTEDEYNALTQAEIDAQAQKRADNWVNFIKNPLKPVEPTKEELEAYLLELEEQQQKLESEKLSIQDKISKK